MSFEKFLGGVRTAFPCGKAAGRQRWQPTTPVLPPECVEPPPQRKPDLIVSISDLAELARRKVSLDAVLRFYDKFNSMRQWAPDQPIKIMGALTQIASDRGMTLDELLSFIASSNQSNKQL